MKSKQTALVTGANRGIGREIARQLATRGVHVYVTARTLQSAQRACDELRTAANDLDLTPLELDVCLAGDINQAVSEIERRSGKLDILINNAGIFIDRHMNILELDQNTFQLTMETNLYGPLRLSQACFPLLCQSPAGRIINLSSGLGAILDMGPGFTAYSVSKTALNALTIKLAAEFQPYGILVNCMCPGWVKTEMGGVGASRSVEQGADTAVWLALDQSELTGCFFHERQQRHW